MNFPWRDCADDRKLPGAQGHQTVQRIYADRSNQVRYDLQDLFIGSIPLVELCQRLISRHRGETCLTGDKLVILVNDSNQSGRLMTYCRHPSCLFSLRGQIMMILHNGENDLVGRSALFEDRTPLSGRALVQSLLSRRHRFRSLHNIPG